MDKKKKKNQTTCGFTGKDEAWLNILHPTQKGDDIHLMGDSFFPSRLQRKIW